MSETSAIHIACVGNDSKMGIPSWAAPPDLPGNPGSALGAHSFSARPPRTRSLDVTKQSGGSVCLCARECVAVWVVQHHTREPELPLLISARSSFFRSSPAVWCPSARSRSYPSRTSRTTGAASGSTLSRLRRQRLHARRAGSRQRSLRPIREGRDHAMSCKGSPTQPASICQ
jgi:hypothetical protein